MSHLCDQRKLIFYLFNFISKVKSYFQRNIWNFNNVHILVQINNYLSIYYYTYVCFTKDIISFPRIFITKNMVHISNRFYLWNKHICKKGENDNIIRSTNYNRVTHFCVKMIYVFTPTIVCVSRPKINSYF